MAGMTPRVEVGCDPGGKHWPASVAWQEHHRPKGTGSGNDAEECQRLLERVAELEQMVNEGLQQNGSGWQNAEAREWLETARNLGAELAAKQDIEVSVAEIWEEIATTDSACAELRQRTLALRSEAMGRREALSRQINDFDQQRAALEERAGQLGERSRMTVERFQAQISALLAETDELRSEVKQAMAAASARSSSSTAVSLPAVLGAGLSSADTGTEDDWEDEWEANSSSRSNSLHTTKTRSQALPESGRPGSGRLRQARTASISRVNVGHNVSTSMQGCGSTITAHTAGTQYSAAHVQGQSLTASQQTLQPGESMIPVPTHQGFQGSIPAPNARALNTKSTAGCFMPEACCNQMLPMTLMKHRSGAATPASVLVPPATASVPLIPTLVQPVVPMMPVGQPTVVMMPATAITPRGAGVAARPAVVTPRTTPLRQRPRSGYLTPAHGFA